MNISKLTKEYIENNPSVKECVGLINFSSLARQIIKDKKLNKKYFNAIMVAANRISQKLEAPKQEHIKLLKNSKLNIRGQVCRFVFAPHAHIHDDIAPLHVIKTTSALTVIVDQEHFETIAERYEHYILAKEKDLVEVAVISEKHADVVQGLTSHLSGLLASKGVNVISTFGSFTDDVFVIKKEDLSSALVVLDRVIG